MTTSGLRMPSAGVAQQQTFNPNTNSTSQVPWNQVNNGADGMGPVQDPNSIAGLPVTEPSGNMIIDIGGGTTEIAVIALGGIVCNQSIRIAGDGFTADIQSYMRHQHNIKIGERTAENIKIQVGSALPDLEDPPEDFPVRGPNLMTAMPIEIPISYQEIAHCLDKSISKIETSILAVLEQTPPELYADIVNKGIYMAGGGALLRGLGKRFTYKINIPFHLAEDPLQAIARGTGIALKNVDKFSFLMR